MKIYLNNENKEFHKIVCIKSSYNIDIEDDLNTIIEALLAYGYTLETIQDGFIDKCLNWDLINKYKSDEENQDD